MYEGGEVTIPLRQFLLLEAKTRELESELETAKRQLEEERGKTWKLFGNFFEPQRVLHTLEDDTMMSKHYVIEVKQPLTKMVVQGYNLSSEWDVVAIYRRLIDEHVLDVVKAVDVARHNPRLYP